MLEQCENAKILSKVLVSTGLEDYMFHGESDAKEKADHIATFLRDHIRWCSHGRHLNRHTLENEGLKISNLEKVQEFQDLGLSVFHATTHTFSFAGAVKIIENQDGKAFVKMQRPIGISAPE